MGGLLFVVLEIIIRWVVLGGVSRTIIYTKSSDAHLVTRSMTDSGLVGLSKSPLRNWGAGKRESGVAGKRASGGAG